MKAARRVRAPRKVPNSLKRKAHRPKLRYAIPAAGLAAGLAAAPLAGHLQAPSVFAECDPHRDDDGADYLAGSLRSNVNATGVRARISVEDTWVKPGNHAAYGHVALKYLGGAGPYRYMRVGWLEFDDNERHYAVTYNYANGGTQWYDILVEPVVDDDPLFSLYLDSVNGRFKFYVESSEVPFHLPPDDPAFTMFIPNHAMINARINTLASQMPGEPGNLEHFHDAVLRIGSGGLDDFLGDEYSTDPTYFGSDKVSGRHWHVWDKDC